MQTLFLLAYGGAADGFCYLVLAPRGFSPAVRRAPPWRVRFLRLWAAAARWATGAEPLALEGAGTSPAHGHAGRPGRRGRGGAGESPP